MKKLIFVLTILCFCGSAFGQGTTTVISPENPKPFSGAPTGSCGPQDLAVNTATGDFYSCNAGAWLKAGGTITSMSVGQQTISGADYTNSTTTPSTVISWTLPATSVAKNYAYTCHFLWESTNTTLIGPVIGLNLSVAPTQLTGLAWAQSALAGTDTTGYLSNATTGSQTLITGAAAGVTSTNYKLDVWGTIEGAATTGSTFIINAAATNGTTATLNIRRGGGCLMTASN